MGKKIKFDKKADQNSIAYNVGDNEKIDAIAVHVFEKNKLVEFLPFHIVEFDLNKVIVYELNESYIPLQVFFQQYLQEKQVLQILLNMVNGLLKIEDYLLLQSCITLDTNYIYINNDNMNIKYVYRAVERKEVIINWRRFFQNLLCNIKFAEQKSSLYLVKILNFLQLNIFNLKEFKTFLNNLLVNDEVISTDRFSEKLDDLDGNKAIPTNSHYFGSNDKYSESNEKKNNITKSKYRKLINKFGFKSNDIDMSEDPFRKILNENKINSSFSLDNKLGTTKE